MTQEIGSRIAGVILAAGGSTRLGQPKALLSWQGEPFVLHVVHAALESGLDPVVVVAGAVVDPLQDALGGTDCRVLINTDWEAGQSTSVRAGIQALPPDVSAAVFFLVDQPHVTVRVIQALVDNFLEFQPEYVLPVYQGVRGNPVLFSHVAFKDLMNLKGDRGGRAVLDNYAGLRLEWDDPGILFDVDSLEDYNHLLAEF